MILLPLLLAGLAATVPGRVATARMHELRGRLGLQAARPEVSTVRTRLAWACARAPAWKILLEAMVEARVGGRDLEVHDEGLERGLPWLAIRLTSGEDATGLPWRRVWEEQTELPFGDPTLVSDRIHCLGVSKEERVPSSFLGPRLRMLLLDCNQYVEAKSVWFFFSYRDGVFTLLPPDLRPDLYLGCSTDLNTVEDLSLSTMLVEESGALFDWIAAVSPDLSRFTLVQAFAASAAWHEDLARRETASGSVRLFPGDQVLTTFDNGSTLVELHSKRGLEREGEEMGHCVGGYWPAVRDGRTTIWSVRSAMGEPLLTLELHPQDKGRIVQVKGAANLDPKEILEEPDMLETKDAIVDAAIFWARTFPQGGWRGTLRSSFGLPLPWSRALVTGLDKMAKVVDKDPEIWAFLVEVAADLERDTVPEIPGVKRMIRDLDTVVPLSMAGRQGLLALRVAATRSRLVDGPMHGYLYPGSGPGDERIATHQDQLSLRMPVTAKGGERAVVEALVRWNGTVRWALQREDRGGGTDRLPGYFLTFAAAWAAVKAQPTFYAMPWTDTLPPDFRATLDRVLQRMGVFPLDEG